MDTSEDGSSRLAVYGTLAPGEPNNDQLDGLSGRWIDGTVRGRLLKQGWGAYVGYPGVVLDSQGPEVEVQVFESTDLLQHWERLDQFEGPGYRRTPTSVKTRSGELPAFIYELVPE